MEQKVEGRREKAMAMTRDMVARKSGKEEKLDIDIRMVPSRIIIHSGDWCVIVYYNV